MAGRFRLEDPLCGKPGRKEEDTGCDRGKETRIRQFPDFVESLD
ncbi:MAG: hypothetical protein AB7P32_00215 [Nitrospirales bacterium]